MDKYRISIGLLILVIPFITGHYFTIPDFVSGLTKGVAIGILLMVIIKKTAREKAK